jgi:hypothetical protein
MYFIYFIFLCIISRDGESVLTVLAKLKTLKNEK